MSSPRAVSLDIVIVGAGIAGLATAIALRRAGHKVAIYERSSLNHEIGAAIHVAPNASRGLLTWGLDPVGARFVTAKCNTRYGAADLKVFSHSDNSNTAEKYRAPWFFAHRVDLHTELKRLATAAEGIGRPAVIHLKSEVVKFDAEAGSIQLSNGDKITGDLVIAADGVHTLAAAEVLGADMPAIATHEFAYRFLIPSKDIAADPETASYLDGNDGRIQFYVGSDKRVVCYPCRNNEEQNFVAIFHDDKLVLDEGWNTIVDKSKLLEQYKDFHPSILAVFNKAKEVKQWPLLYRAPVTSWHKGKLVLVGDAAHPMLPHQGQGGAQAIEDAQCLGIMLSNLATRHSKVIGQRLALFERVRINRASVMQIFSNAGQDSPEKIKDAAAKFIPAETVPKNPGEFFDYNFGYDVVTDSERILLKHSPAWQLPDSFVQKMARVHVAEVPAVEAEGQKVVSPV